MIKINSEIFVHIDLKYQVLIPAVVATAIIFAFVLIVISVLCIYVAFVVVKRKSGTLHFYL